MGHKGGDKKAKFKQYFYFDPMMLFYILKDAGLVLLTHFLEALPDLLQLFGTDFGRHTDTFRKEQYTNTH